MLAPGGREYRPPSPDFSITWVELVKMLVRVANRQYRLLARLLCVLVHTTYLPGAFHRFVSLFQVWVSFLQWQKQSSTWNKLNFDEMGLPFMAGFRKRVGTFLHFVHCPWLQVSRGLGISEASGPSHGRVTPLAGYTTAAGLVSWNLSCGFIGMGDGLKKKTYGQSGDEGFSIGSGVGRTFPCVIWEKKAWHGWHASLNLLFLQWWCFLFLPHSGEWQTTGPGLPHQPCCLWVFSSITYRALLEERLGGIIWGIELTSR